MIPSLRLPDSDYGGRSRSAFGRIGSARSLSVWVDTAQIASSSDVLHLLGFAAHSGIELVTTTAVPGARVAELVIAEGRAGARIVDASRTSWIGGGPVETYEALVDHWAPGIGSAKRESVLRSALLATVADIGTADVFVTDDAVVRDNVSASNAMTAEQALAVVGLYLRSNDDFTISHEPHLEYNRGLFYWLLARDLMPSWGPAWRDLAADGLDTNSTLLNGLGHALIVRVGAALRARDRAYLELHLLPDHDAADEFLIALDTLLLTLEACSDVVARVLNRHYQLGKDRNAGFRKEDWLAKLLAANPGLAPSIGSGSLVADMAHLVGAFRNSIHSVPLQTVAHSTGAGIRAVENLLVVPPESKTAVTDIIARRGGATAWGARPGFDDLDFLDPAVFTDVVTRHVFEALDATIATQVGPTATPDPRGDWGDTPEVLRQFRALSGAVGWSP